MAINNFIALLKKEYEQYCLLQEKASLKQQAIINNDVEQLVDTLAAEQEILNLIEDLEAERQQYLKKIAEESKLEKEEASFKELLALFPEEKEELRELRKDILYVLKTLQQINEENRQLIQDCLQINNYSLNLIRQAAGKGNPMEDKKGAGQLIDHKA
ncbi:MAG: hypothetical protein PWR10_667 [Halanaerobiales bacterium]|nr:hypothetical protein [Halanaerobiales bacterium]